MKSTSKKIALFVLGAAFLAACQEEEVKGPEAPAPNVTLLEESLHPEGIIYSAEQQKIFAGSYYKGKIVSVDLDGNMQDFAQDGGLVAVVGLDIDPNANLLLACNSDAGISMKSDASTTGQLAEIVYYDLNTGVKVKTVDLSNLYAGGHFLNDLCIDDAGNVYVTDSFSAVIYKIDTEGNTSVLTSNAAFQAPQGAFGLNGIVYHPGDFLIAGVTYNGTLFKIPLDNPSAVQEIAVNGSVNSLDGLLLTENNTLILISNNFTGDPFEEAVYELNSVDEWSSASIGEVFTDLAGTFPTTATKVNNDIYVNHAYFPDMVNPATQPVDEFIIQRITF
jgi:sugar lactone lactonase YvrE